MIGVTWMSTASGIEARSTNGECAITVPAARASTSAVKKPSDASHTVTRPLRM